MHTSRFEPPISVSHKVLASVVLDPEPTHFERQGSIFTTCLSLLYATFAPCLACCFISYLLKRLATIIFNHITWCNRSLSQLNTHLEAPKPDFFTLDPNHVFLRIISNSTFFIRDPSHAYPLARHPVCVSHTAPTPTLSVCHRHIKPKQSTYQRPSTSMPDLSSWEPGPEDYVIAEISFSRVDGVNTKAFLARRDGKLDTCIYLDDNNKVRTDTPYWLPKYVKKIAYVPKEDFQYFLDAAKSTPVPTVQESSHPTVHQVFSLWKDDVIEKAGTNIWFIKVA